MMTYSVDSPDKENIVAVITSFNPDPDFKFRIDRVLKQVAKIIIIDNNSDDSSFRFNVTCVIDKRCSIIQNLENFGVAIALNQGIEWAISNHFKWILFLDQDTIIHESFIEEMSSVFKKINNQNRIGILGSRYKDKNSAELLELYSLNTYSKILERKFHITSGSLIPIQLFEQIGKFKEEYFIDYVDIEFCLRLRSKGFKIIVSDKILMQHSIGHATSHHLLWKQTGTSNHPAFRRYYMMRNNIIIIKKYFFFDPFWSLGSLLNRLKSTLLMVFFEGQKMLKIRYSFLGFMDGLLGKYNRVIKI